MDPNKLKSQIGDNAPLLSNRPQPKAMVPVDIVNSKEKQYKGDIFGYYIENTNYYNIVPSDAQRDENRITCIGYIFEVNIEDYLSPVIKKQIKFLSEKVDPSLSPVERLQMNKHKKVQKDCDYLLRFVEEISILNSEEQRKVCLRDLHMLQNGEKVEKLDDTTFVEKIRQQLYKPRLKNKSIDGTLIGYWKDKELHLIQVSTLTEVKIETYALKLDVFSRNTGILESSIMLNKGALFIGCGSVGSLVAVELAKAGVGRFMLVDNDIFGYHNICRHQCGIYDVGRYKTDAVADRILQINPYAQVIKKNSVIQDVDIDEIKSFCNENTIVIGGADNREGDLYASRFALSTKSSFMSIGCWERAFAGEIFFSLPEGMPTYEDFLAAIGYTSGRVTQNRRFYTTEEELEKVSFEPGISADINFVTIVAVKLALDILNRNTQGYTQRLLSHLTQYTLVCNTNNPEIGGEDAELFKYPLQVTTSIKVPYAKKKQDGSI